MVRCGDYKDEVKCVVLIAMSGGVELCDELEGEDLVDVLVCRAAASEDLDICYDDRLSKTWQETCRSIADSALRRIYG